jgi:hypothetical protein
MIPYLDWELGRMDLDNVEHQTVLKHSIRP